MLSINAEPGFFQEVFEYMKHLQPQDRNCNLILDALAICIQIIYDYHNVIFVGSCDFGGIPKSQKPPTTEALGNIHIVMFKCQMEMTNRLFSPS